MKQEERKRENLFVSLNCNKYLASVEKGKRKNKAKLVVETLRNDDEFSQLAFK